MAAAHAARRTSQKVPQWSAMGRGLIGRCPRCGGGRIFASLFEVKEYCPTCGMRFEREEGYWLGAMAVVTAVVLILFALIMVAGLTLFGDDIPWVGITIVAVAVNGGLPIFGYGWAKTTWMGIEQAFNPPSTAEEADALNRMAAEPDPV